MVAQGLLGRKSGAGFYKYNNGRAQRFEPKAGAEGGDASGELIAILGFGVVGVASSARRAPPERLFLLLAILTLAVNPIVLYGAPRYKVPVSPFIAMIGRIMVAPATGAQNSGDDIGSSR